MSIVVDDLDSEDLLPRWFGDYALLKHLGKGGMGQVFLARLPGLEGIDRACVIKTLRPQWTNDAEYVARFVDEARVVVQLNHKNICPVFDVGLHRNTYYLAMDLVPGRDLQAVVDHTAAGGAPLSVDVVLYIVAEMLEALDAAHRLRHPETDAPLNLVHRDVSPHNVLVSFEGEVKLIDFGLAKSTLKHQQTEPGVVLGKLAYMAPEHARGEAVDRRTDVFAVGVMLYELLLGERYWYGLTMQEIWGVVGHGTWAPPGLARLPADLQAIIQKATAATPAQRFVDAAAMRQQLVQAQIARGTVASSAELRGALEERFPEAAGQERRERARLLREALPARPHRAESTRIAAAAGLGISPAPAPAPAPASAPPPPSLTERPSSNGSGGGGFDVVTESDYDRRTDHGAADPSTAPETDLGLQQVARKAAADVAAPVVPAPLGAAVEPTNDALPTLPNLPTPRARRDRPRAETERVGAATPTSADDTGQLVASLQRRRWTVPLLVGGAATLGILVVVFALRGPSPVPPTAPVPTGAVDVAVEAVPSPPAALITGHPPVPTTAPAMAVPQEDAPDRQRLPEVVEPQDTPPPPASDTPPAPTAATAKTPAAKPPVKTTVKPPVKTTAKPKPPPPPPNATPAPEVKHASPPWPPALPRGLMGRMKLLKERCVSMACARQEIAVNARFMELSVDEAEAHQQRILVCLEKCRDASH